MNPPFHSARTFYRCHSEEWSILSTLLTSISVVSVVLVEERFAIDLDLVVQAVVPVAVVVHEVVNHLKLCKHFVLNITTEESFKKSIIIFENAQFLYIV